MHGSGGSRRGSQTTRIGQKVGPDHVVFTPTCLGTMLSERRRRAPCAAGGRRRRAVRDGGNARARPAPPAREVSIVTRTDSHEKRGRGRRRRPARVVSGRGRRGGPGARMRRANGPGRAPTGPGPPNVIPRGFTARPGGSVANSRPPECHCGSARWRTRRLATSEGPGGAPSGRGRVLGGLGRTPRRVGVAPPSTLLHPSRPLGVPRRGRGLRVGAAAATAD